MPVPRPWFPSSKCGQPLISLNKHPSTKKGHLLKGEHLTASLRGHLLSTPPVPLVIKRTGGGGAGGGGACLIFWSRGGH